MDKKIRLSPSAINLFNDCQRCFWISKNEKIDRPRGIYPSLPGGMDQTLKEQYDAHRKAGLKVIAKYGGLLFQDIGTLEAWRNWRKTDLAFETDDFQFTGALDDCYQEKNGNLTPLDFKTRGTQPKEPLEIYAKKYYQTQMDAYALMLQETGHKISGEALMIFYWPQRCRETDAEITTVEFTTVAIKIPVDPEAARKKINAAVKLLQGPKPESNPECEYCQFVEKRNK